jgi:hypothetical protein
VPSRSIREKRKNADKLFSQLISGNAFMHHKNYLLFGSNMPKSVEEEKKKKAYYSKKEKKAKEVKK